MRRDGRGVVGHVGVARGLVRAGQRRGDPIGGTRVTGRVRHRRLCGHGAYDGRTAHAGIEEAVKAGLKRAALARNRAPRHKALRS